VDSVDASTPAVKGRSEPEVAAGGGPEGVDRADVVLDEDVDAAMSGLAAIRSTPTPAIAALVTCPARSERVE
jgi:hypothetical protein